MKDDIKEFIEFRTDEDGTYFYYNDKDNIEQWSYKLDELKDYITNLQEELKSANESISWWQNRFNAVEKENKRLKELCNKYEEEHSTAFKLWTMKMEEMPDYEEKMDYKSRIDKAIEYIKEHIRIDDEYPAYMEMLVEEKDELLNILNGGDK